MIVTRVARHLAGENLYFGRRALGELLGHETMTGLMVLAVTGRGATDAQRELIDACATALTSADPRIWPLKLARLASSYGSIVAGYCAGQLAIEGERIGPWVIGFAAAVLAEIRAVVGDHLEDEAALARAVGDVAARRRRIAGFGVPLRPTDERLDGLLPWAARTGRDRGAHWRVQEALSGYMRRERGVERNVGIAVAALLLDAGFAPEHCSALSFFLNQNVFEANAVEAARQQAPEMQKLPDAAVEYVGPPPRQSPRAR